MEQAAPLITAIIQGLVALVTAGVPILIAWLRSRAQRETVRKAVSESVSTQAAERLADAQFKENRFHSLMTPGTKRLGRLVREEQERVRMSTPPPSMEPRREDTE